MSDSVPLPVRHLKVTTLACMRGEHEIFTNLGFDAAPGEAVLVRGPNGVGKTSLLMCLAGFLPITSGTIAWQGRNPDDRPNTDMHFIGHQSAIKPGLTTAENLDFWAIINGANTTAVSTALNEAGLEHAENLDAALLSAGQTRRLALARLSVSPRPVWLLDEPTAALDAQGDKWVTQLIDIHLDNGGIVIAATHLDLALKKPARIKTLTLGGGK